MRFGGHQTFYVRQGWLFKGLELLIEKPELLIDDLSFDYLGVGKNMASSIQHWLLATGLAGRGEKVEGRRTRLLEPTFLAQEIWNHDRYFSSTDTWWLLHTNLLHNRDHAETWYWMFNDFNLERFDRETCLRRLMKYVQQDLPGNAPKQRTVERDLGCLLNTYAVDVPTRVLDPEEDIWCPFRDLDLLVHYRSSGHLQLQRRRRHLNPFVVMYALERALSGSDGWAVARSGSQIDDIRFFDLCRLQNNPMKVFCLHSEGFFETLVEIERLWPEVGLKIVGLAGDRQVRIPRLPADTWATRTIEALEVPL